MAKAASGNGHSIDLGSLDFSLVLSAAWHVRSETVFRAISGNGDYYEFRGANLAYSKDGMPKGGTIDSFASSDAQGKRLFVIEGAKMPAEALGKAASTYSTSDDMQLFAEIFKGNDSVKGGSSWDVLIGFAGNDKLFGAADDDKIYAGADHDRLYGGAGRDWLYGEDGNDFLAGEAGKDVLTGGGGRDTFVFNAKLGSANADVVADFNHRDDTFRLSSDAFKDLSEGALAAKHFKAVDGPWSDRKADGDDRVLYDKKRGDLYFDRDGSGTKYDPVKFAEVKNNTTVDHTDFFVV